MTVSEEIEGKKRKLRGIMAARGLDAILIKKQGNFSWITAGGSSIVGIAAELGAAALLFTKDGQYAICNNVDGTRMEFEEGLPGLGYEMRIFDWWEDREAAIVAELVGGGKLGSDFGFPGSVDISKDLNPLRYSLCPPEVERYKALGLATARAIEETMLTARPGDKECEVVGRLAEKLWAERVDYILVLGAADERISRFRHPVPTEKRVEKRLMLSVNSRKHGLIVSLTRFVQFGKVPADLADQYRKNVYIDSVLMASTIPGRPAREAYAAGIEAYREAGYPEEWRLHHQGGSIGYVGRDYKVNPNTADIVQENQGFTWNPSITGTKSEDTILATSSGPVMLSPPLLYPTIEMDVLGRRFVRPAILEL